MSVSTSILLTSCARDESAMEANVPQLHETYSAEQFFQTTSYRMGGSGPYAFSAENDELVVEVRANDVPVEYVLFEDEGYGFRKRVDRIVASEAYLSFLQTNL